MPSFVLLNQNTTLMAIPPKKGLVAQFHWLKGSVLVNINGGHSEGYIRNAGLGSVPKIA